MIYTDLVAKIYENGFGSQTRNGITRSLFGEFIKFETKQNKIYIPEGRKLYPKQAIGEFKAFLKGPKSVADFEAHGCRYWAPWADKDGNLNVDYGNAWIDYNGVNQIEYVIAELNKLNSRRALIDAWRPDRLNDLSLPCCHYSYQFNRRSKYIDLLWIQRSTDVIIGLPYDIIVAQLLLKYITERMGLLTGEVIMSLGNVHIYMDYEKIAFDIIKNNRKNKPKTDFNLSFNIKSYFDEKFNLNEDLDIKIDYKTKQPEYKLKVKL